MCALFALPLLVAAAANEVWPLPSRLDLSGAPTMLDPTFTVVVPTSQSQVLIEGAKRYQALIQAGVGKGRGVANGQGPTITAIRVTCASDSEALNQRTLANYSVTMTPPKAGANGTGAATVEIAAATPFGALCVSFLDRGSPVLALVWSS